MGWKGLPGWVRFAALATVLLLAGIAAAAAVTEDPDERLGQADAVELARGSFVNPERVSDLTCVEGDGKAFRCSFRFDGRRCSAAVSDADGFQLNRCKRRSDPDLYVQDLLVEKRPGRPERTQVGSAVQAQRLCDEMQDGEYDELLERRKRIEIQWPAGGNEKLTCSLPNPRR